MSFITPEYKASFARLRTAEFWRNMAIYFCVFSIVGHLMEIPYCMFNSYFFDIVDRNGGVLTDYPLKPYMVYGFCVVFCIIFVGPFKDDLLKRRRNFAFALVDFYIIAVLASMCFELAQGFLQNMPDENGVYPLWDNSHLPGNILGQAWIVNDILLGGVMTLFVWGLYPLCERGLARMSQKQLWIMAIVFVVEFIVLVLVTYGIVPVTVT